MDRKPSRKRQKQSKEEIGEKACIREHNRLMKMNECYDTLRQLLNISPSVSKAKTLVEAIQYIKMLHHVLEAPQQGPGGDDDANGAQLDTLEMAEQLEESYTLNDDLRAIFPTKLQHVPIGELLEKMPYFRKLLSLTTKQTSDAFDSGRGSVEECCSTPSCKPMPLEDANVQIEDVTEQTLPDASDENDVQQEPVFTENSYKFLIKNLLQLPPDPSDEPTNESDLDCPLVIDEDSRTNDPSLALPEPEQYFNESLLIAALETNVGEASYNWLENNLPENDEFFDDQNRLIELDLTGLEEMSIEELLNYVNPE